MRPLLIFTVLFVSLAAQSQTLIYDAYLKGHKVGQMEVTKEVSDNKTTISANTHIVAHMLFTIKVDVITNSTYMDGILVEADAVSKQNGHVHSSVKIDKKDNGYVVDVDGDQEALTYEELVAADMLYFNEPQNLSNTYALASAQYLDIEIGSSGEYFFVHDGKKESHKYKNGVLEEVVIDHKLYTVTMKLRE